jgi:tripartite-type tricarboxylate transporter receptor subunit TctC
MKRLLTAILTALIAFPVTGAAQGTFPTRPIKLVAPFPPGGGTDIFARLVASKLSQSLGWSVIVENKPGAAGSIGVELVTKSAPDGYTLVLGQTSNLAINPVLYPSLGYDPVKDLTPVALVASTPLVLVASPKAPFKSLAELVAAARARPGSISIASPGNGTVGHLTGELFMRAAGIRLLHVPYKGAAPALNDVLGGQVDIYFATAQSVAEHVKAGTVLALGVTSAKRIAVLPNVPTIAESGYKNFEAISWYGVLAPAGTPAPIVMRLASEITRVLATDEVRAQVATEGGEILAAPSAGFAAFLASERVKWGSAVRESGAKVD